MSEARRLRDLEQENARLGSWWRIYPGQGRAADGDPKKRLELIARRGDVALVRAEHGLSERRACKLLGVDRVVPV